MPAAARSPRVLFRPELVERHGGPAPRYTSYPTALQFSERFTAADWHAAAARSQGHGGPLSLYVHLPFCANPCFYCACTRIITRQRPVIARYLVALEQEIAAQAALLARPAGVAQLHFGGGTPTYLEPAQLEALLGTLDAHFHLGSAASREYSIEIDPRTVDGRGLEHLVRLGFNRVSLGVQDFDADVQRAVNRLQPAAQTLELIAAARALGLQSLAVDLILGLPRQTPQSFARTLEATIAARPDRIAVYNYAHLPRIFPAQRRIALADLPAPATRLELMRLAVELLTAAGYVYIGMDHFALPDDELVQAQRAGTLQRNFQGYSTHGGYDLVGLGMSAISRVQGVYAQNARRLDRYQQRLAAGELALERGLVPSRDDRIRADVIERLMCHGEVSRPALGERHGIDFDRYFARELEALQPLVADGLVELDDVAIRVTPAGRLLLRAVARVFDAYLATPQAAAHSRTV